MSWPGRAGWRRASLPTPWRRASLPTPCRRLADASGRASGFAQGRMRGRKHRKVQTRAVIHRCTRNKQTHTVTEQSHTDDDTQTQRRADGGGALQAMRGLAGPRPTPENMIRTGTQWAGRNLITTHSDTHIQTHTHTHTHTRDFAVFGSPSSCRRLPPARRTVRADGHQRR